MLEKILIGKIIFIFILNHLYHINILLLNISISSSRNQEQGHHSSIPGLIWLFVAVLTPFAFFLARSRQRYCFGRSESVSQGFTRRYHASSHGKLAFYWASLPWYDLLLGCKPLSFRSRTAAGPSTKPDKSYRRMAQSPRRWRPPWCQGRLSRRFILDLWADQHLYTKRLRLAQRSQDTP